MTKELKSLFWIWTIALVLKLVIAALLPMSPDEAYYWVWSHHPQLSYFDHPPFTAWLFSMGHFFEGWAQAVRWPAVIFAHLGIWIWLLIFKKFLNPNQVRLWLALALLAPLTGVGSIIVTPDLPLMVFWPLAIYCLISLLETKKGVWALSLGAALGLGFCSKYVMALFAPIALVLLWKQKQDWSLLKRWLIICTLGFLATSWPVWIWNMQNGFVSFLFQLQHGLGRKSWKPSWTYEYILGQIGLLSPFVVYYAFKVRDRFLLKLFAWAPLGIFIITSYRGYVEANWPIVAHPVVLALAVLGAPASAKWLKVTAVFWNVVTVALLLQVLFHVFPIDESKSKLRDLTAYEGLGTVVKDYQPLFARSYQVAAKLSFDLKRPIYKLKGMNRVDFYDFRPESVPPHGRYFVIFEPGDELPQEWVKLGHKVTRQITVDPSFSIVEIESP